jgi:hypothetical protein
MSPPENDTQWSSLYRLGAVAALAMVALFAIQATVYIVWPPPTTVAGYFALFQKNKLLALLGLDLLLVVDQVLAVPIALALYFALRRANPSVMIAATGFSFVGIAAFLASRPAFDLLYLSNRYAAAATDSEKTVLLAAGQAMLAIFNGTAFHTAYVLGSIAVIMVSAVMLRSHVFSKACGYVGLLEAILGFGLYVPVIGIPLSILSAFGLQLWNILIARRLLQMAGHS